MERTLKGTQTPEVSDVQRVDVLGVGISCITLDRTVDLMASWIDSGRKEYVCVTGMHGVMESRSDSALRDIHNHSGITTPDGMPMVWSGRWAGAEISRVYGPDLMRTTLARAEARGWSHFFYGGAPGVTDRLIETLRTEFPGLQVAGAMTPPFRTLSQLEKGDIVDAINATGADFIWVALGTPKQERWMAEFRSQLDAPVLVGVGAAFDLIAGTLRQAPLWMQRSGLEWLFRLAVEPRRLWRRYVLNIPRFAFNLLRTPPRLVEPARSAP